MLERGSVVATQLRLSKGGCQTTDSRSLPATTAEHQSCEARSSRQERSCGRPRNA